MLKRTVLFFLLLLTSFSTLSAQQTPDDDVVRVDSTIVRLNIGVVDRSGRPVTNLSRDDFTVYEDGVKQPIARFEPSVTPFSVVMLLDMSGSTKSFRQNIQLAAARFIEALAPDDRVAVIEFYNKVNLRNDFTTDRRVILRSIAVANGQGDTNLYKALEMALDKLRNEGKRRKAIVVLTDGVDTQMQNLDRALLSSISDENEIQTAIKPEQNEMLNRILNSADRQGVTIYPLALPTGDPKRLADPTPKQFAMYAAARERLQFLANRTGGTLNAINRLEDMGRLYAVVAAEIRSLYTVEYQPSNDRRDGKWRAIKIEVSNADLIARTREGYFAR
jgi:VWFA-related protein